MTERPPSEKNSDLILRPKLLGYRGKVKKNWTQVRKVTNAHVALEKENIVHQLKGEGSKSPKVLLDWTVARMKLE